MKKDTRRKISWIAFLLAAWMTVSAIPATALGSFGEGIALAPEQESAALEDEVLGSDEALTVEETELSLLPALGEGEKTVAELSAMEVNAADIPEVIPMSRAQEKGLVNRLRVQEEDLSTLIYQTKSGNKTAYVYSRPVKYVAADGSIRDKSTAVSALTNATYAYAMEDNSVKAYFPKSITGGVLLAYNDYRITMTPEVTGDYTPLYNEEEKAVVYAGVFGEATFLTYKPQMYGLKEDVILAKNPGVNRFDFVMTTRGLTAQKGADGIWRLYNSKDEAIAGLGQVIVKDSAGKTAVGELEVTLLSANRYRVSVIAPQEFLNASDTFYPVYVDPTTTVYERENREFYDEEGDFSDAVFDTIIDVGLYESSSDVYWANQNPDSLILGDSFGLCRIIYKLYDFYGEHGYFTDLYAEQIGNVTLYLQTWDASPCTATVRPMNATWELSDYGENPVALCDPDEIWIWDNVSSNGSTTFTIEGDDTYAVDITQIARGWASYNRGQSTAAYHNPAYGFCVSADSASSYTYVYAANAAPWGDVYYEVDYSVYGGLYYVGNINGTNINRYHYLALGAQDEDEYLVATDYITSASLEQVEWIIDYQGQGLFCIRHGLYSDYGLYTNGQMVYCALVPNSNIPSTFKWSINISDVSQNGIYIKNVYNNKYLCCSDSALTWSTELQSNSSVFDDWILARKEVVHSIEIEEQGEKLWCWAAVSKIFSTHYYPSITSSQEEIVTYVMGSPIDVMGDSEDMVRAINYCVSTVEPSSPLSLYATAFGRVYSEETLKRFLDDGHVVCIGGAGYLKNEEGYMVRQGGHAVLLNGYVEINGSLAFLISNTNFDYYKERWLVYYDQLLRVDLAELPTVQDHSNSEIEVIWETAVVIQTSYSGNIIPYIFQQ